MLIISSSERTPFDKHKTVNDNFRSSKAYPQKVLKAIAQPNLF